MRFDRRDGLLTRRYFDRDEHERIGQQTAASPGRHVQCTCVTRIVEQENCFAAWNTSGWDDASTFLTEAALMIAKQCLPKRNTHTEDVLLAL